MNGFFRKFPLGYLFKALIMDTQNEMLRKRMRNTHCIPMKIQWIERIRKRSILVCVSIVKKPLRKMHHVIESSVTCHAKCVTGRKREGKNADPGREQ